MKLSLTFLFRNNIVNIDTMLNSALPFVDEVVAVNTGSADRTDDAIRAACAVRNLPCEIVGWMDPVGDPRWISNFAAARRMGWERCTGDMLLWLDTDDVLVGGGELRAFLEEHCDGPPSDTRIDVIAMLYDYQFDPWGRCTVRQKRDRISRNGYMSWAEDLPVHEILVPTRPGAYADDVMAFPFKVVHDLKLDNESAERRMRASAERNLWIIERWEATGKTLSGRLWGNKGDALRTLGRHDDAIAAYDKCLSESAWVEERYDAFLHRGDSQQLAGRLDLALDDYSRAARMVPWYRAAWLAQAEVFLSQHKLREALAWCDIAGRAVDDTKGISWNPAASESSPLYIAAKAHFGLQEWEKALICFRKLDQIVPDHPLIREGLQKAQEANRIRTLYDAYNLVGEALPEERRDEWRKIMPTELAVLPGMTAALLPPPPEDKPFLVIYCHRTENLWGPSGLERGVGGSEEAVIEMSRGFAARGWHVEVYGMPPTNEVGKGSDGVWWLPFYAVSADRKPDVFVAWRDTRYLTIGADAGQRYIWLQDIPSPQWYTPEMLESIDGILCISRAQSAHLPAAAAGKVVHTGNAIDPEKCMDGANEAHRFIYFSSPDRGLMQLLEQWPIIRGAIPNAQLDVYYGFRDVYMAAVDRNPKWLILKETIERLAQQPGVVWHGMVGVSELHKAIAQAGFWLYPTSFEESYCTNAAKAMAMGAIPVTSRYAGSSLPEVCGAWDLGPDGDAARKIEEDPGRLAAWTQRVIQLHRMAVEQEGFHAAEHIRRHRAAMKAWARENLTWDRRIEQWNSLFSAKLTTVPEPALPA